MSKEETLEGKLIHVKKLDFPSLGQILKRSEPWCELYGAVKHIDVARETMIDNVKDKLNSVAAETVHRLGRAGLTINEIAIDTGLTENYVIQTMEALAIEATRQEEDDHG